MNVRTGPREVPTGVVSQVLRGVRYPLEGLAIMRAHKLWRLALVPILVNIVLFGLLVALTFYVLVPWIEHAEAALTPASSQGIWARVLAGLAKVVIWALWIMAPVAVVVVNAFLLVFVGQAVASPFLDVLSERVEQLVLGVPPAPASIGRVVRSVSVAVADVVWSLLYWLAINVPLLLLNLLPLVGSVVAAAIGFCFTAWLFAVEFGGLPLTRYFITYPGRWHAIWQNRWLGLGLGMSTMVLLFVPLLSLVMLPVAAVGGTLMYCDLRASNRLGVAVPATPSAGK